MTAIALTRLSSVADLFVPVDLDLVANLIRAHDDLQARVRRVHATTQDGPAIAYFAAGAARSDSDLGRISLSSFQLAPALAALGADHWSKLVLAHHAARTLGETRVRGPAPKAVKLTTWALMSRPLPGAVRAALGDARLDRTGETLTLSNGPRTGYPKDQVQGSRPGTPPRDRITRRTSARSGRSLSAPYQVLASGCVPDTAAHQFYPTPGHLADRMVTMADVGALDVLEPSAGHGAIASRLPVDQVTCVEVSALHVAILRAKGLQVHQADFLTWASTRAHWSRIVMNPPFGDGRWQAHLTRAVSLLALGGRVVAMLPASARSSSVPAELGLTEVTWSEVLTGEFAGTSVSTVILTGVRDR